jgi:protein gp37
MTKIEWCDKTENLEHRGCTNGCPWCYAKTFSKRLNYMECARWLKNNDVEVEHLTTSERLSLYRNTPAWCQDCHDFSPHVHNPDKPINLPKKPMRIFIDSMWDFCCKDNPPEMQERALATMEQYKQHTFIVLTQRPKRYKLFTFPKNVILGTTIRTQNEIHRVYELVSANGNNLKALSIEPCHSEIVDTFDGIDWIIVGAQTGHNPKPTEKKWIRGIIRQARLQDIPIFLKNNLEWPELIQEFPD